MITGSQGPVIPGPSAMLSRMPTRKPAAALAFLVAAAFACGPATPGATDPAEALRGLGPRRDPPVDLGDEADLERARAEYRALDPSDPSREGLRKQLVAAYEKRITGALANDAPDEAYGALARVLTLWTAFELRTSPPADFAPVAASAEKLFNY